MRVRYGNAIFWILLALHLVPVWIVPCFVTQDGPSHLENANILRVYGSSPLYQRYFDINWTPVPNWFGHIAEAGLLAIFPAGFTEKLFVSGYVLLFPISARWAVGALRPEARWQSILVFPLVFNCLTLYGFSNFCWSVCFFLLMAAYCLGRVRSGVREGSVIALLALAVYFCHIFSWLACVVLVFSIAIAKRWRWRNSAIAFAAFAPSAAMAAWFISTQPVSHMAGSVPIAHRWTALWRASTIVFSYDPIDRTISTAFGIALFTLTAVSLLRRSWNIWAPMAGLFIALYFFSPPQSGIGQYVLERWNLYALVALVLIIASAPQTRPLCAVLVIVSAGFSIAILTRVISQQRAINRELSEYLSVAPAVQPGSTLLPVQFDSRGPGFLQSLYGLPMRHAAGYLAVQRRALNLDNYEAQTTVFPLIFREAMNPGVHITHIEDEPPSPQFAGWPVDYVLLWDPLRTARQTPEFAGIEAQLAGYTLVQTSGAASLYRRR